MNTSQEWIWANVFDISTVQTGPFGTQLHKSDYTKSGTPIIEIGDVHPNRNLSDGAAHFISNILNPLFDLSSNLDNQLCIEVLNYLYTHENDLFTYNLDKKIFTINLFSKLTKIQ